jgi:hypothetical protein
MSITTGVMVTLIGGPMDGHQMMVPRATPRIFVARPARGLLATDFQRMPLPDMADDLVERSVYIHLFGDRYLYNAIWDRL